MAPEKWKTRASREVYKNPWIQVHIAHLFIGYGLSQAELPSDDTEEFEKAVFPFEQVLAMVNTSEIRDAMTIIAVLHAAQLREQKR